VAFCWHAYPSQIYAEVRRLERRGLLAAKEEARARGAPRRVYTLTEAGRDALVTWLRTPAESLALKDDWLLRIWTLDHLPPGEARALLDKCRRLHAERLATYRRILRTLTREHGPVDRTRHDTLVGPFLCLQQGIWHEQMYVRWCRWASAQLAARSRTRKGRAARKVDLHALVMGAREEGVVR
jgi:DNA-binding PadR family transcriptional regulator